MLARTGPDGRPGSRALQADPREVVAGLGASSQAARSRNSSGVLRWDRASTPPPGRGQRPRRPDALSLRLGLAALVLALAARGPESLRSRWAAVSSLNRARIRGAFVVLENFSQAVA